MSENKNINSANDPKSKPTDKQSKKPIKPKGPIRTEAVIPITVLVIGTFLYTSFLFDSHLRKAIEWTGTYVHGAEVNVNQITTSFLGGSFVLSGLQITDKENPINNALEINEIRFGFLWNALLRLKFVVHDAGIDGIQLSSPRKSKGWVKPPEPPSTEPSAMAKLEQNVLQQTQSDFKNNALGDIAALLEGTDEKEILQKIQGELKAEKRIKELEQELKDKQALWKERLDKLPNKKEFDELVARAKAIKLDTKNPKQFAADLKEVSKIAKEADAKVDALDSAGSGLKKDIEKFTTEFKELDDMVKQDIKDIEARMKIPDLDVADFSKNIFGKMFSDKLTQLQKYMEVGRKYMPPPKDKSTPKDELIPPARGAGKNFHYPVIYGYPLFWLQKATISSKSTEHGFSGDLAGQLTNVTTDPQLINKPAVLNLAGHFPKSQIYDVKLEVIADHIDKPKDTLALTVGKFQLVNHNLVSSNDLSLGLVKANGNSSFNAELQDQNLAVALKNNFTELDYDLTAKSKVAKEAISSILAGIPAITLNASASGYWDKLDISMNSNLGSELSRGLKRFVQAKVDAIKAKIKDQIEGRISGERKKLNDKLNEVKGGVDKVISEKKDEVNKASKDLKSQTSNKADASKGAAKEELKEKGKKFLKGLKF